MILPPHFDTLFGDAAIYAEPAQVPSMVSQLYADRQAYDEITVRADTWVRATFGYEAHQRRLSELIGTRKQTDSASHPSLRLIVRCLSVRRLLRHPDVHAASDQQHQHGTPTRVRPPAEPDLAPHFLSLSQAVGVVAQYGFPFEYVPSAGATGLPPRRLNKLFTERVSEAVGRLRPTVVVFDGTWPYNGIRKCAMRFRRRVGCGRGVGCGVTAGPPSRWPRRPGSTRSGSWGACGGVRQGSDLEGRWITGRPDHLA